MNHFQKSDALVAAGASENDTAPEIAFARGAAQAREHARQFSQPDRGHARENSAELLSEGARIASFLRGHL